MTKFSLVSFPVIEIIKWFIKVFCTYDENAKLYIRFQFYGGGSYF